MMQYLADQIGAADIARVREERDRELSGKTAAQPLTTDEMQAEAHRQVLGGGGKPMQYLADQIGAADIARVREERDRELSGKRAGEPNSC